MDFQVHKKNRHQNARYFEGVPQFDVTKMGICFGWDLVSLEVLLQSLARHCSFQFLKKETYISFKKETYISFHGGFS